MYLKIPEYISRNSWNGYKDGRIAFTGPTIRSTWNQPLIYITPEVGDLLIFSSEQLHSVHPFISKDGQGERRSVSFNARHGIVG